MRAFVLFFSFGGATGHWGHGPHVARETILSTMNKIMLKKTSKCVYEKFVDLVEYNISRNNPIV